jgi:hypothetical protein
MVRISRATEFNVTPLPIRIVTDRVSRVLNIPGPINSIEIPGRRVYQLDIPYRNMYEIRIVSNDIEYDINQIGNLSQFNNVEAILISDRNFYGQQYLGYGPTVLPGYTYRPQFVRGGQLVESGKSFVYPGQIAPILPPSPCITPAICPYYPYGY